MIKKKIGRPTKELAAPKTKVDRLFLAVVNFFNKSQTDTADALNCSQSHIWSNLRRNGKKTIKPMPAMYAEVATAGKFKCDELCPELKDLLNVIIANRIKAGEIEGNKDGV